MERGCELASFEESGSGARALVKRPDGGIETVEAAYIAGCDGAHSAVRTTLGIGFGGGTYDHLFYVADVQAAGTVIDGNMHVAFDTTRFPGGVCAPARGRRASGGHGAQMTPAADIAASKSPGRT